MEVTQPRARKGLAGAAEACYYRHEDEAGTAVEGQLT